jgi:hypothetical protein
MSDKYSITGNISSQADAKGAQMTIKERIYREWLLIVIFVRLFVRNVPFFRLKFLLFVYAFTLLLLRDYISEIHRGDNPISSWFWLPAICLFLIEPLNQFTFYYAKNHRQKAILTKAIIFWLLFTIYHLSDIIIRLQAEKTGAWVFSEKWSAVLILFLISAISPWYSFCPDIRFFILYGKFQIGEQTRKTQM